MSDTEENPLVSIVTLNYNGLRFLKPLLDSLKCLTYPNVEVILVDNCSTDGSVALVEKQYPWVRILVNPENYMYARGNNEGIAIARGKYICLLNNDVVVEADFLNPLVQAMEQNHNLGAVQPKILDLQRPGYYEYAGAGGGHIDWLGYPFSRGRIFYTLEKDEKQYDEPQSIFWASGACILLRSKTLEDSGLIDEAFVLHQEEIDLCWRIHLCGWDIHAIPQSAIHHYGGGTLAQNNPRKTYWNFRNNLFLMAKNFSASNFWMRFLLRVPLDVLALVQDLLKGNPAGSWAVIKAYGWLSGHIPLILERRADAQKRRKVSDREILKKIYRGSIVYEYFLRGRKHFSQLRHFKG